MSKSNYKQKTHTSLSTHKIMKENVLHSENLSDSSLTISGERAHTSCGMDLLFRNDKTMLRELIHEVQSSDKCETNQKSIRNKKRTRQASTQKGLRRAKSVPRFLPFHHEEIPIDAPHHVGDSLCKVKDEYKSNANIRITRDQERVTSRMIKSKSKKDLTSRDSSLKSKVYSSCQVVSEEFLSSLRLPQELVNNLRSKHLKKLSSPTSKYYFEYKYAELLNKRNGFHEHKNKRRKLFLNNGLLSKLFPLNVQEEKEKFLRTFQLGYELKCPKFKYQRKFLSKKGQRDNIFDLESENLMEGSHPYHYVCTKYLDVAIGIMEKMKKKFGNLHNYYELQGGKVSPEDALNYFAFYLRDQGLAKLGITIQVCEDTASPTFCKGKKLIVRLPIKNYRMLRLQGVAHHEIGTHLIRYINNTKQPWYKKKALFGLHPHMITEEGLATLNSYIHAPEKLMCHAAIHYYAIIMASRMNFVQLFTTLYPWIGDEERTWTECLRVKRGISAKRKGAFSKDQIYLIGVIKILRKRKDIDFRKLYAGKIALEDLDRINVEYETLVLPKFIEKDPRGYMNALTEIARVNGLAK